MLEGWRLQISFDNGSTWTTGPEIQGLTQSTLDPRPVIAQAIHEGRPGNTIKIKAQIKQYTGTTLAQFTSGTLIATMTTAP